MADFQNPDQVGQVVTQFVSANPIHILVNNTGGPPAGPVLSAQPSEFLSAFQQHLICNHLLATAEIQLTLSYKRTLEEYKDSAK